MFIITGERICPWFIDILNSVVCYLERGITEMVDLERVIAAVFQERPSIWRNRQRGDPIFLVQCPVRYTLNVTSGSSVSVAVSQPEGMFSHSFFPAMT